jgi:hypothetical protein
MAEPFDINLTEGAEADLKWFAVYAQRIIVDGTAVAESFRCDQIRWPAGNFA